MDLNIKVNLHQVQLQSGNDTAGGAVHIVYSGSTKGWNLQTGGSGVVVWIQISVVEWC